jgi:putative hemolysin
MPMLITRRARLAATSLGALLICGLAACTMPSAGPAATTSPVVPPPLSPTATPTGSTTPTSSPSGTTAGGPAAAHCVASGGQVQLNQPTYNTNQDQSQWIKIGEPVEVCAFASGSGQQVTRIWADLKTIYASQPTLAALAYLAKKPLPASANPNVNPASTSCLALGGTDSFGGPQNMAGGGMVTGSNVWAPCTFADGSFIEEWGITYYSQGDVRGKDLKTVFRFNTDNLPPVFSS